jgi:hypothetical protein
VPYTTLVPGTTITSAWANANVRDQVVTPFATVAARTSAITSPVTGMLTYRVDLPGFEAYDSVGWVPVAREYRYVDKTADEVVTSSTAFQNDDHLVLPVAANAKYKLSSELLYAALAAADLKTEFAVPSGATGELKVGSYGVGVLAAGEVSTITSAAVFDGGDTTSMARLFGTITTAGTAGTIQLRWAQNTSNGTGTTIYAGSYLELTRVG